MAEETVAQPEAAPTSDVPAEVPQETNDPFAVDESQFVSLSPEQRAALDPVLSKFRESAKTYAQKEREAEGKKYQSHIQKAQALEKLAANPKFVEWYQSQMNPQTPATPQSIASAEEWAQAYQSLSAGDPLPLEKLQTKLVMSVGGPAIQRTQQEMTVLRQENAMNKLFASHADAKDLDEIGREDDPNAPSLLQLAAQSVMDRGGGSWEQAYALAKQVALSMENKGKRAAMGLVTDKKNSTTEKPSVNTREEGVQYVDSMDEAMSKNIEAQMDGRKVVYRVKK